MKKYVLGIDVGGTNVKLGLVDTQGKILSLDSFSTTAHTQNKNRLIDAMIAAVRRILTENEVSLRQVVGIGMGLPGLVDVDKGKVIFLPNIPGWRDVPLKKIFEAKLKVRTLIENDVNLITLGEWKFGAGCGYKNLICITLGTGVGSGLVLDGALYRGEGFAAGELGHVPLNEEGPACNCGGYGCFERYVGNTTLQSVAAEIFKRDDIRLEEVSALAAQGDKKALGFWEDVGIRIGNGLVGVVNMLNPRCIIVGGGVANSDRFLFPAITKTVRSRAMQVQGKMFKIVKAQLGNQAGIVGALVLCCEGK